MHWRAIQQLHRIIAVVLFLGVALALANYCAWAVLAEPPRDRQADALDRIADAAESFLTQEYGHR